MSLNIPSCTAIDRQVENVVNRGLKTKRCIMIYQQISKMQLLRIGIDFLRLPFVSWDEVKL